MREVKRECRTLRISAEQNTSVRIADYSVGFVVFAAQSHEHDENWQRRKNE